MSFPFGLSLFFCLGKGPASEWLDAKMRMASTTFNDARSEHVDVDVVVVVYIGGVVDVIDVA